MSNQTLTYGVGDIVEYRNFGGQLRTVTVTVREEDIKNGRPGFDGVTAEGEGCWGYDDQITRITRTVG